MRYLITLLFGLTFILFSTPEILAQRLNHSRARAPQTGNRHAQRPSGNINRPSTGTINGGAQRNNTRPSYDRNKTQRPTNSNSRELNRNITNINRTGNRNNVNINNNRNVNINVNRTVVVRNPRPYRRPPYTYGGFHFYCYHPYYYHPYRPYYWGPAWHPVGFFITVLAVTAVIVTIENQKYYYDQGVYYIESGDGYTVVQAPLGATVNSIPSESQTVVINETTNNYYYGGTYYEKEGDEYKVVPPTAGSVVENLPDGAEEVRIGDQTYVKYGETYYQPIQVDGKDMYEVVNIEEAEE